MNAPNAIGHAGTVTPQAIAYAVCALGGTLEYGDLGVGNADGTFTYTPRFGESVAVQYAAVTAVANAWLSEHEGYGKVAVAVIPGIILREATEAALEYAEEQGVAEVLISGYHGPKRVADTFDQSVVRQAFVVPDGVQVLSQGHARHCGHQAEWLAEQIHASGFVKVFLFVHASHTPRAWGTLLEALRRRYGVEHAHELPVAVIPVSVCGHDITAPSHLNVALEVANGEGDEGDVAAHRTLTALEAGAAEMPRLESYSQPKPDGSPGDVLPLEEARIYLLNVLIS